MSTNKGGTFYIQGEEPELGLRIKNKFGRGVIYNPSAIVYHKVLASKLKLNILIKRSFNLGFSKVLLNKLIQSPESLSPEKFYLKDTFLKFIPGYLKRILLGEKRLNEIKRLLVLVICVFAVCLGYVYGHIKYIARHYP